MSVTPTLKGKSVRSMKLPKNDKELEELLTSLGRTPELIEGIKDFGKLAKSFEKRSSKKRRYNATVAK